MVEEFQSKVRPWLLACFGEIIAGDREERNHRFLEEALELVQACGCTAREAHQLVDYTYGREVGFPPQEVGGVMVTLAALCLANDLDMHAAGWVELDRIWGKVEQIRAKQAAKPKYSPLPESPHPTPLDLDARARDMITALRTHAFDDCGERDIPTHVANLAADLIEALALSQPPRAIAGVEEIPDEESTGYYWYEQCMEARKALAERPVVDREAIARALFGYTLDLVGATDAIFALLQPGVVSVEQGEDVRGMVIAAFEAGCQAVHDNYQEDRDPDFTEAAHDYANSLPALNTNREG